jgi:methanogenic corrinoid protein MtbC1
MPLPRVEPLDLSGQSQPAQPSPEPKTTPAPQVGRGRIRLGRNRENHHDSGASSPQLEVARLPEVAPLEVESSPFEDYQRRMIAHLVRFDRDGADRVWREAYAKFSARELCINLLQPVQIAIGEGWHRGEVSVAAEHFSTSYITSKIASFLNSYPDNPTGQVIVTGCVQGEMHETGIMMLSLFLRWQGYKVIYIGANVPNSTLYDALTTIKPDMLLLSATMKENGNNMTEVGHIIARLPEPKPLFGYGGAAFIFFPELRDRVNGYYLGDDPSTILTNIKNLLDVRRMSLKRMN